jgi:dihydrofolate reductase
MGKLIYSAITSLDGYIEDASGSFDWAEPDEEVHSFINELERSAGTHLYGRRLYETMAVWETLPLAEEPPPMREYAEIWRQADKIVYSTTLEAATTARTRIERRFDPDAIRQLKAATPRNLHVGGAGLASAALAADLVDEVHLFLAPIIVGGGKQALPDGLRLPLALQGERAFSSGMVYLRYGDERGGRREGSS